KIFVRRGGPNYQEGLRLVRQLGDDLGVEIHVYGPETHITEIVPLALLNHGSGLNTSQLQLSESIGNAIQDQMVDTTNYTQTPKHDKGKANGDASHHVEEDFTPIANPRERMTYFEMPDTQPSHPWYAPFAN